jgi:aerobic-type carbon monoxide dehydrogenase small subunit (CoxS/CutS family)
LRDGEKLHPIQKAFSTHGGYQCGFCTPGQMMSAKVLLDKNPKPTEKEVRAALAGNLCRCAAYPKIIESVLSAAEKQ